MPLTELTNVTEITFLVQCSGTICVYVCGVNVVSGIILQQEEEKHTTRLKCEDDVEVFNSKFICMLHVPCSVSLPR